MIPLDDLALGRELVVFVKEESAFGTLPAFVSTDALVVNALPGLSQPESFTPSKAKKNTRSLAQRFKNRTPAGTWNLATYVTPSGAAGTAPAEKVLVKSFFGTEAESAGVSMTYSPAMALPSFGLGYRVGHTVFFATGCVCTGLKLPISEQDGVELSAEGKCRQVLWAGTADTVADSTTTVLKLVSGGAKRYSEDARVQVGSDDNAGAGYSITDVDHTADTITISPAMASAPAADVTVKGFLPTATYAGEPLENVLGVVTLDSVAATMRTGTISLSQEVKMLDDVKHSGGDMFAAGFIPDQRQVTADLDLCFLKAYLERYADAREQNRLAVELDINGGAGKRLTITMPRCECDMPELSENLDVEAKVTLTAFATSAGEDEITWVYR